MTREVLGVGWNFPLQINERGGVALSQYERKIQESIRIIIGTAKGERIMRPDFGCDIQEFTFSVIDTSTLTMIKSAVKEALILWEPRIEVLSVEVSLKRINDGILAIDTAYRIRATNTEYNLVYPFYLRPGG